MLTEFGALKKRVGPPRRPVQYINPQEQKESRLRLPREKVSGSTKSRPKRLDIVRSNLNHIPRTIEDVQLRSAACSALAHACKHLSALMVPEAAIISTVTSATLTPIYSYQPSIDRRNEPSILAHCIGFTLEARLLAKTNPFLISHMMHRFALATSTVNFLATRIAKLVIVRWHESSMTLDTDKVSRERISAIVACANLSSTLSGLKGELFKRVMASMMLRLSASTL